jgi:hypothetical protein
MLSIIVCGLKNVLGLHPAAGNAASGAGHDVGSGLSLVRSAGTLARCKRHRQSSRRSARAGGEHTGKNHICIPAVVQYMAYTPPLFCANAAPSDAPDAAWIPQPRFPVV